MHLVKSMNDSCEKIKTSVLFHECGPQNTPCSHFHKMSSRAPRTTWIHRITFASGDNSNPSHTMMTLWYFKYAAVNTNGRCLHIRLSPKSGLTDEPISQTWSRGGFTHWERPALNVNGPDHCQPTWSQSHTSGNFLWVWQVRFRH